MHDTHCHLDLYQNPPQVAAEAEGAGIFTIAVTNLPSAYEAAKPHMRPFRHLKLALGLHPLLAQHHTLEQKRLFERLYSETDFIGEVGLDFSKEGAESKERQLESFRFVLELLRKQSKVATLHTRRAEKTVHELLSEYGVPPVIFHWYSGPVDLIEKISNRGDYFSVNPAMLVSAYGQKIIKRIPRKLILAETDGPFVKVNGRPARPSNVGLVHRYLASQWQLTVSEVVIQLEDNLQRLLQGIRR
mgnify:CR=1 FL=1